MFLQTIDENERHRVLIDDRNGLFLLFADSREFGVEAPFTPHWARQMGDHRTLGVVCRWFAVRRHLWQAWGDLAELVGRVAFARHIDELMAAEPLEEVMGAVVEFGEEPCEIALGEQLAGPRGLRQEVLYRHRFASPAARKRFRAWFEAGRNFERLEHLVRIGYERGGEAVAKALDALASEDANARTRRGVGQRRPSRRRVPA